MTAETISDDVLSRYLLGDLSEEETARVEREFFADDELFDRLETLDEVLTEDYLSGSLDPAVRAKLDRQLEASPARRERVEFARLLKDRSGRSGQEPVSRGAPTTLSGPARWPAYTAAAAAALALAGLVWLFSVDAVLRRKSAEDERLRAALEQRIAGLERSRQAVPSGAPIPSTGASPVEPAPRDLKVTTFLLTSGLTRGRSEGNRLVVPADADLVRLDLALETVQTRNYRAAISKPEGDVIWSREGLQPRTVKGASVVALLVPAASLPPGDYILSLETRTGAGAWESAQDFSFRIARR
jgi:hypothetical protein